MWYNYFMCNYDNINLIKEHKSVCLISHIDPDADALSSMVVLRNFIKEFFKIKKVDIFAECTALSESSQQIIGKGSFNKKDYLCYVNAQAGNIEKIFIVLKDQNRVLVQ